VTDPHPPYKNPSIQEALCEVRFAMPNPSRWSPSKPSALNEKLRPEYPDFETLTEHGFEMMVGPEGMLPRSLTPRLKLRFANRTRPVRLQFGEDTFVINILPPYPGWADFKAEFLRLWPSVTEVMQPTWIKRIGMRYINRVPRESADERPSHWLQSCANIPDAILNSRPPFLFRLEVTKEKDERLSLTLLHDKSRSEEAFGSLIFDIDRITESRVDDDQIATTVERLHDEIWEVFKSGKNDKYTKLLEGNIGHESAA
jgi:uncharacterized protein (TIGR04255 family)